MSASARPHFREITEPADPAVRQAHRLLTRNFHKAERVPIKEWRESLEEGGAGVWTDVRWHLAVAELRGDVIGVATGTYLGNVNTGVIGYLAVGASARGYGVGPALRGRLRSLFRKDARAIRGETLEAVIGEVRPDNPWLRTLVRRDGVIALDFEYHQPKLHVGEEPVPLVLYYEALGRIRKRLPTDLLRRLLYTTWRRIYRIARPLSNPTFTRMLAQLEGRRSIGRLTVADLPALARRAAR